MEVKRKFVKRSVIVISAGGKCTLRHNLDVGFSQDRIGGRRTIQSISVRVSAGHQDDIHVAYTGVSQDSCIEHYVVNFEIIYGCELRDKFLLLVSQTRTTSRMIRSVNILLCCPRIECHKYTSGSDHDPIRLDPRGLTHGKPRARGRWQ